MEVSYVDMSGFECQNNVPVIVRNVFDKDERERILQHIVTSLVGEVDVVDCNVVGKDGGQERKKMKAETFMECLCQHRSVYLRDWHLFREKGEFYEVPKCFVDWMDGYQRSERKDDFRFVYWGGKGSWTPLHTDVLCTFSWSANIKGKKKWVFWKDECKELDASTNYEARDCFFVDRSKFPPPTFECVQAEGDCVFVPCGWFHTVMNMEETISVNQNWSNRWNAKKQAEFVIQGLRDVENEIEHLKDGMDEEEWKVIDSCCLFYCFKFSEGNNFTSSSSKSWNEYSRFQVLFSQA